MAEYIDKAKAVENIKKLMSSIPAKDNYAKGYDAAIGRALIAVRSESAADVQPVKHGHWEKLAIVPATDTGNRIVARCSNCGDTMLYTTIGQEITLKYCGNCGARMDGGEEDENG